MSSEPDTTRELSELPAPEARSQRRVDPGTWIVIVMGVAGSGKTTVGRLLARQLGWLFLEGDDFHPAANLSKMHAGISLSDEDRWPWLRIIRARMQECIDRREPAVVACSALKRRYRDVLRLPGVQFVYLRSDADAIRERLEHRAHFFDRGLLPSQFATLEEPERALAVGTGQSPAAIVSEIIAYLTRTPRDDEQQ